MKTFTLCLDFKKNSVLTTGVWVRRFQNKRLPGVSYTGIYLGRYNIKYKHENGCPIPKYLTVRTVDQAYDSTQDERGVLVKDVVNLPRMDIDDNRLRLAQSTPQPEDKSIFLLIDLRGVPCTGIVDNSTYYQSGRLVQGREYNSYNSNRPITPNMYNTATTITAVVLHQNECCTVKSMIDNKPVMITVSNACGAAVMTMTEIQNGESHRERNMETEDFIV